MAIGFEQGLLMALPVTPAVGSLFVGLLPERFNRVGRIIGIFCALLTLGLWVTLRSRLSPGDGLLVSISFPWVGEWGIGMHLAFDRLGLAMAGLIAVVGVVALAGTLPPEPGSERSQVICLLLAETGMLGVVVAWDLIMFITFWEVTLVPFFFLMRPGLQRSGDKASASFFITSVSTSVIMWVGVLWLVMAAGEPQSFDLVVLVERFASGAAPSSVMAWMIAAAFLMRTALVPLHSWFPATVSSVPNAASVLLAGGVLPLGGFATMHILMRLFGPHLGGVALGLEWIGLTTALAAALISIVQVDLKRLFAYVCLSQFGLAVAGLASAESLALQGGGVLLLANGMAGAMLFLFAGVVCNARGSQRVIDIGGLWRAQPLFAGLAFAAVSSVAAVPATGGFAGLAKILWTLADHIPALSLATAAVLITGSSVVWAYRRVLGGGYQPERWTTHAWPEKRQTGIMALLAILIVVTGLMPGLLIPAPAKPGHATGIVQTRSQP